MFPLSVLNYVEILAFACSLFFWQNIRKTPHRRFVPYLLFIVCVELTGRYIRKELDGSNAWLYNIAVPIEYLFFTSIFYAYYTERVNKKIALIFITLFGTYVVVSLFVNGLVAFNTTILIAGSVFMIVFSVLYFLELYNDDDTVFFYRQPIFWVALGLFLFNTGELSYNLLSKFMLINKLDQEYRIFRIINNSLNVLLYLCISISFLWKRRLTK